jgi:hypothetical protein
MSDFTRLVEDELQMAGLRFDQADLIAFVECNHGLYVAHFSSRFIARG